MSFDGVNDYVSLTNWEWGGTTSFEVYVKYDSFTDYSRVFGFGSGSEDNNVLLCNEGSTSTIDFEVRQGSTGKWFVQGNFDSSTWTHIVATVSGTTMKVYKNGVLVGTKTDGHDPLVMTREFHYIGATAWGGTTGYIDGTIAFLKIWHGVELSQDDVTTLHTATTRYALDKLYQSTDGDSWTNKGNWMSSTISVCSWYGIMCNENGEITKIDLHDNNLRGTVPAELGALGTLTELTLYSNQLSDEIPSELSSLTSLTSFHLGDNQLTGSIPSELSSLTSLTYFDLGDNELTGSIPSWIGTFSSLTNFNLRENELTGSIPSELSSLTSLTYFNLGDNQLTGSIPSWIGTFTSLTTLALYNNKFSGEIPSELSSLTSLAIFNLDYNRLTGSIPSELSSLASLTNLQLCCNQLTGSVPPWIGSFTSLTF